MAEETKWKENDTCRGRFLRPIKPPKYDVRSLLSSDNI